MCKLEKVFIPAFFDIMVHLPIRLDNEAMIAGPIKYRWMYPVDRCLYFLKSYIRNIACLEGCIAPGYIAFDCMTLCSSYFDTMETKLNFHERNYDGGSNESDGGLETFSQLENSLTGEKPFNHDSREIEIANFYILKNIDIIQPFLE